MLKDLSMEKVLSTKLTRYATGEAQTVKEFFTNSLLDLWEREEGFSGKRPCGNSGWKSEILSAVAGKENLTEEEEQHYYKLVKAAIRYMCL
jgi:hypothetical protein